MRVRAHDAVGFAQHRIERAGVHPVDVRRCEPVATVGADDAVPSEDTAKIRDVGVERIAGAVGRYVSPDLGEDAIGVDSAARIEEEQGQDGALARPAERERCSAVRDLDRTELTEGLRRCLA